MEKQLMVITASKLRSNIYQILDRVLETGEIAVLAGNHKIESLEHERRHAAGAEFVDQLIQRFAAHGSSDESYLRVARPVRSNLFSQVL